MKAIVFTAAASKEFDVLPVVARTAIENGVDRYAREGAGDVKRVSGRPGFRLRVGEYRVVFNEDATTILDVYVGRRNTHTYDGRKRAMAIQILKTPGGDERFVPRRAEYERLASFAAEALEDADDAAVYDSAMADLSANPAPHWPAHLPALLPQTKSRLAAIRKWRGLSQFELSAKVGIQQGYLSDLETKRRSGAAATLGKLAEALDVPLDWLA